MSARQVLTPEMVRARALDESGHPTRTVWARARDVAEWPLIVTVDHRAFANPAESGLVAASADPTPLAAIEVTLSELVDRTLMELVESVCPRPGARIAEAGPSLSLDAWCEETSAEARRLGHLVQHWSFPRLVIQRARDWGADGSPLGVVHDDPAIRDRFAHGLAIEHPANAMATDLWWPTAMPAPVRAYQWVREGGLPPVTVG